MMQIEQVKGFPNNTPIDSIEGRIKSVYDYRQIATKFGATTVQSATLEDVAGNIIRLNLWGHADASPMKGTDVVITGSKDGKGVKVVHGSYKDKNEAEVKTVELEVGKAGQFQTVAIHRAQNGSRPAAQAGVPAVQPIRGDKVGMAIKAAVDLLSNKVVILHPDESWEDGVKSVAATLIRISTELEQGK